jgi:hypothetical protein
MATLTPPPEELVRGWTDMPLAREGEKLADKLGRDLKGSNIAFMTTSDLERAEETAKAIENIAGIPLVESTKKLRTWNLGELEGAPLKDVQEIIRYYVEKSPNEKPKGAETFNEFVRRVLPYLIGHMKTGTKEHVPIAEMTHHWVCELFERWVRDGARGDLSFSRKGLFRGSQDPPGTVLDAGLEEAVGAHGKWSIKLVNPGKTKQYADGPVLIRHATTNWNAQGGG